MAHQVFISYASEDQERADWWCARIEAAGLQCWIGSRDIGPSKVWAEEISRAICAAEAFVLLLSRSSAASIYVKSELQLAVNHDKPVFCVLIEDVTPTGELELHLARRQWVEAWGDGHDGEAILITALTQCVANCLASPSEDDRPRDVAPEGTLSLLGVALSAIREPSAQRTLAWFVQQQVFFWQDCLRDVYEQNGMMLAYGSFRLPHIREICDRVTAKSAVYVEERFVEPRDRCDVTTEEMIDFGAFLRNTTMLVCNEVFMELAEELTEAGKPVYIEKPPCKE